ncbi:MAG: hypothetical protein SGI73_18405 [Chloroflexota bacterium]|nr:hypothetical protein [Chloroflexota bacterium]
MPKDQIAAIMTQLLAVVPEKLDEAKLGEVVRALILLRQQRGMDDESEMEVDGDEARERLAHLIARLAESGGAQRDSE